MKIHFLSWKIFRLAIVSISLLLTNNSFCQLDMHLQNMDSTSNFYTIQSQMNSYLDSLENTMDSSTFYAGGGEFKAWKFFEKLWEP